MTPVYPYYDASVLTHNMPGSEPSDPHDDEKVVESFQAMFIKTVFLRPAFTKKHQFFAEEEDSSLQAGNGIYNEIMIHQVSLQMAEQDAFSLKKVLAQGVQDSREKAARANSRSSRKLGQGVSGGVSSKFTAQRYKRGIN